MIVSYHDKKTERLSLGERERAFEQIEQTARFKLNRLKAALTLNDIAMLPGNRFEKLRGARDGQFSIRINDQWRICFTWDEDVQGFANVEVVDYH